jgi:hypothetical protein
MQTIKYPTNTTALVLYYLLTRGAITERDTNLNGFRARISDLRELGLNIHFKDVEFVNQFGRASKCREHRLEQQDRTFALQLYDRVNVDNRGK